jgi:endo-1,4-beta-xylanase
MSGQSGVTRRSVLLGAAAAGLVGAASPASGLLRGATGTATADHALIPDTSKPPLWRTAARRGIVYGSAAATWQLGDYKYRQLLNRESAMMFTQDDLLWYVLKPTPHARLDFSYADKIIDVAERYGQLVYGGPGLVWDEGFGDGWTDDDLWGIDEKRARHLLFGTLEQVVKRYRGRVAVWSVCNEVIIIAPGEGKHGLRTDVPWWNTIGPEYVAHAFWVAQEADPDAMLLLNDTGYETVNEYGDRADAKRAATLRVLDRLLGQGVPIHAMGIEAHLLAYKFADRFHQNAYRTFLAELADRGLKILITEMDVNDDGLPANHDRRDQMVADVYRRFLDVALDEPAVAAVLSFGLSDRVSSLQEDYPPEDFEFRRPLPFSRLMRPKPAFYAISHSFRHAVRRWPTFEIPRG